MKYYETEFTITAPECLMQDARDVLAAIAGEIGYETFEDCPNGIKGYVQQEMFSAEALDATIDEFPFDDVTIRHITREAEYRDWNEQWENEGFEPIFITADCVVHDGRHLPEKPVGTMVEIDAKLAFGTGTHETTRMVAQQLIATSPQGKQVLDCGCGTGILGIIALKLGATRVMGYDIDEWSADNARHNAVINGLGDRYEAFLGDVHSVEDESQHFDIILANINRNILIADMPIWQRLLLPGGKLILSGLYASDVKPITKKAEELGLSLISRHEDAEWQCLVLGR